MDKFTKRMLIASIIMLILDFLWIGVFMGNQYKSMIRGIQGKKMTVNLPYALGAYILMIIAMGTFVIPNITSSSFIEVLKIGGLFGIILYGVYDFTAGAIIKDWSFPLAVADVLWGGFLFFICPYIAFLLIT